MATDSVFEQNLELFAHFQPKVAYMLPYHDPSDVQQARTDLDEFNLMLHEQTPLHAPKGAQLEAKAWFSSLSLEGIEVLYVYGVGLGYAYLEAKSWLREDSGRYLVFLEDSLSVLYALMHLPLAQELLSDPQVALRYSENLFDDKELTDWLCWDYLLRKRCFTALDSYQKIDGDVVRELDQKLSFDHHRCDEAIDEYLSYGVSYYRNFYHNLGALSNAYNGVELQGKFQGIPAVICGAGPSLDKVLESLASIDDRALVLAGGSAINALNRVGIIPDVCAGVDPNPPQYDRLISNDTFEAPFFYRQRMFRDAFRVIHGPQVYLAGGGGYDTASYFETALGIAVDEDDELDEGHNVVNFLTSIAQSLGCNPIIFVGLDLAYTGMQAYAEGVVEERGVEETEILTNTGVDKEAVLRTDIYGQPTYTLWKWIVEADWLANFAEEHCDVTWLNATEGGLGIRGVKNISLEEAISVYMPQQKDLQGCFWAEMQKVKMPENAFEKLTKSWKHLYESLGRCISHFDTMLEEWAIVARDAECGPTLPTGTMALMEISLEEEIAYFYVLDRFNQVFVRQHNREFRRLQQKRCLPAERLMAQAKLETRRFAFLKETAEVHLALMQEGRDA